MEAGRMARTISWTPTLTQTPVSFALARSPRTNSFWASGFVKDATSPELAMKSDASGRKIIFAPALAASVTILETASRFLLSTDLAQNWPVVVLGRINEDVHFPEFTCGDEDHLVIVPRARPKCLSPKSTETVNFIHPGDPHSLQLSNTGKPCITRLQTWTATSFAHGRSSTSSATSWPITRK